VEDTGAENQSTGQEFLRCKGGKSIKSIEIHAFENLFFFLTFLPKYIINTIVTNKNDKLFKKN